MEKKTQVCWLQLSDLHIFYSTEWEIMLKSYEDLAKVFKPDFVVVTGDFCHKIHNRTYDDALKFLNKLAEIFSTPKNNFFFVPGNHDASSFKMRKEIITTIDAGIDDHPDIYLEYNKQLQKAFKEYNKFVENFYENALSEDDERVKNPSGVYCIPWQNKINIVTLNTALVSSGKPAGREIVDIQGLSQLEIQIDKSKPTLVLAHHSPNALVQSQRIQLERLLAMMNVRAYLCGDEHKLERQVANKFDIGNQIVGIICGKSVVEPKDVYSDVCIIGYTWKGNRTNVEVFKWLNRDSETPYQLIKSDTWYHHVDKPFSFKMMEGDPPAINVTEKIEDAWNKFLVVYKEEDRLINQKLGQKQVKNKSDNFEPFSSEKIMRSLVMIGIPFPAVAEITRMTIDMLTDLIPANISKWELDTKMIRLKVLEAIRSLDGAQWATDEIGSWCTKYIRRYGHNNRVVELCNIPGELNDGKAVNGANYKFIKEVFLPDLFQAICPSFDMNTISKTQIRSLADEIISFINGCDVYMIDYTILKQMVQEIVTKPPHPWIINDEQRKTIIAYDRHAVESNLEEIARCEANDLKIPHAVFVELLHHISAMMLDRYFSFCGCSDLDAFSILIQHFRKMIDYRFDTDNWDLRLDNKEIKRLSDDFSTHGVSISDYYSKLRAINPQKVSITDTRNYVAAIKDFATESLSIISH